MRTQAIKDADSVFGKSPDARGGRIYFISVLAVVAATLVAQLMVPFFDLSNIVMIYILGVVVVATKYGLKPSILASILSVAAFDVFFVPPFHTFAVEDVQFIVTFAVMLVISIVISTLTARIRRQSELDRMSERRSAALYAMSRSLSAKLAFEEILKLGLEHICEVFEVSAMILVKERGPQVITSDVVSASAAEGGSLDRTALDEKSIDSVQNGGPAVQDSLSGISYLPIIGSHSVIGVLVVSPRDINNPPLSSLLETFVSQIALASERALLSEEAERTRIKIKTEELRNALLSCVSHDLRTPLATITGAASCIMDDDGALDMAGYRELAREVYNESVRLNTLVGKLLDMTKIASGTLSLKQEWQPVDELLDSAIVIVGGESHDIRMKLEDELAIVYADPILIQQVLINLLENAIKYTPTDGNIEVSVQEVSAGSEDEIIFSVSDRGPGVEEELKEMVFDKFFRANERDQSTGFGLGLAICKGIVEAHGGRIWLENRQGGGAVFSFALPSRNSIKLEELTRSQHASCGD
ncbi:MAG: DUF4118 domain-containing protein [Cyanobacteriota/Melainabacteria group bacterium]